MGLLDGFGAGLIRSSCGRVMCCGMLGRDVHMSTECVGVVMHGC